MPPRRDQYALRPPVTGTGRSRLYNLAQASSGNLLARGPDATSISYASAQGSTPSASGPHYVSAAEAPYLTNLEQHFGRVTLTAPDNMLRKQAKEKKQRIKQKRAQNREAATASAMAAFDASALDPISRLSMDDNGAGPSAPRRPDMQRAISSGHTNAATPPPVLSTAAPSTARTRRRPASNPRLVAPAGEEDQSASRPSSRASHNSREEATQPASSLSQNITTTAATLPTRSRQGTLEEVPAPTTRVPPDSTPPSQPHTAPNSTQRQARTDSSIRAQRAFSIHQQASISLARSRAQRASLRRHNIWDDISHLRGADEPDPDDLPPPFPEGATRPRTPPQLPTGSEAEWTDEQRQAFQEAERRRMPDSPPPAFRTDPESEGENPTVGARRRRTRTPRTTSEDGTAPSNDQVSGPETATGEQEEASFSDSSASEPDTGEIAEERREWEEDLRASLSFEERLRREQDRREARERSTLFARAGISAPTEAAAEPEEEASTTVTTAPAESETPPEDEPRPPVAPASPPAHDTSEEEAPSLEPQAGAARPVSPLVEQEEVPEEPGAAEAEEPEMATFPREATPSTEPTIDHHQGTEAPATFTPPAAEGGPEERVQLPPVTASPEAAPPASQAVQEPDEVAQLEESEESEDEFWFASETESEGSSPFEPMSNGEDALQSPAVPASSGVVAINDASNSTLSRTHGLVQVKPVANSAKEVLLLARREAKAQPSTEPSFSKREPLVSQPRPPVLVLRPAVEQQLPRLPVPSQKPAAQEQQVRPPAATSREPEVPIPPAGVFEPLDSDSEEEEIPAPKLAPIREGPAEVARTPSATRRFPPPRQRTMTAPTPSWLAYIPSKDKGKLPAPLEPERLASASAVPASPPTADAKRDWTPKANGAVSSVPERPSQLPNPLPPCSADKRISAIISRFETPIVAQAPPSPASSLPASSRPASATLNGADAYDAYKRRSVSPSKLSINILLAPRVADTNAEAGPVGGVGEGLLRRRPPPPTAEQRSRSSSAQMQPPSLPTSTDAGLMPPLTLPASSMPNSTNEGSSSSIPRFTIPRSPRTMAMDTLLGRDATTNSAPPQVPSKSPIIPPDKLFRPSRSDLDQSLAAARAAAMSRRENKQADWQSSTGRRPLPVPQGPPRWDNRLVAGLFGPVSRLEADLTTFNQESSPFSALEGRRPLPTLPDSVRQWSSPFMEQSTASTSQSGHKPQLSLRPPTLPERPRGRQWDEAPSGPSASSSASSLPQVTGQPVESTSKHQQQASDESEDEQEEILSSPVGGTPARTASEEEPTASNLINAAASAVGATELNRRISMRPRPQTPSARHQPPTMGTNLTRSNSIGFTDLDLLVSQLETSGSHYEQLSTLGEFFGPAKPTKATQAELNSLVVGKVECESRRRTREGKVKQKLSVVGVRVDKCAICLAQFREGAFACVFQCLHVFHEGCARRLLQMVRTCPTCRCDCFASEEEGGGYEFEGPLI